MTVTAGRMEEDLKWLRDNGYHTVLPRELADGEDLPKKAVLLTFDDGYRSNYQLLYPLLEKYRMKAVISIITCMPDLPADNFLSWDMCREMTDSGLVEIGSHTNHLHNLGDRGGCFVPGGINGIQRDPAGERRRVPRPGPGRYSKKLRPHYLGGGPAHLFRLSLRRDRARRQRI